MRLFTADIGGPLDDADAEGTAEAEQAAARAHDTTDEPNEIVNALEAAEAKYAKDHPEEAASPGVVMFAPCSRMTILHRFPAKDHMLQLSLLLPTKKALQCCCLAVDFRNTHRLPRIRLQYGCIALHNDAHAASMKRICAFSDFA